jgi:dTDP-4-dehydrorhamnose 3,5-epimerase
MEIVETGLKDCYILKPKVFKDDRGYFFESYNQTSFSTLTGLEVNFVQDNQSYSSYGVIRGLHAQAGKFAQAKLVRAISGEVLDVAVDARPDSPTFGQHFAIKLNEENQWQLFIPRGFLHGFAVLSKTAIFSYKCDNLYSKVSETGVHYASPILDINWLIPQEQQLLSEKDLLLPYFKKD